MRRRNLLVLLFTSLLVLQSTAQAIHLDVVPPSKEDSWGRVRGMVQDKQGFLWLATQGGLYRYDGFTATAYHNESKNPNSLAKDWVESIYGGTDDFLLLGTYGSGMDRFDLATGRFTHYPHRAADKSTISNDTVTAIVKDREGFFWLGTHNGLNRFNPKTGTFIRYMNDPADLSSLSDNQVWVLFVDRQGTLWVGTKSPWVHDGGTRVGGLNRFDPKTGRFTRYMHDPKNPTSLINNTITALFEDSRGTFWVGTAGDGLHTMNRQQGTFIRHRYDPAHPEHLSRPAQLEFYTSIVRDYITFITQDQRGEIYIGTFGNGVNIYNPMSGKLSHYGSGQDSVAKLTGNSFDAAYITRDGTFWIGSHNGNLFKTNPFKTALPHVAFNKRFTGFHEENDGALWISTNKGLLRKAADGKIQSFLMDMKAASPKNNMVDMVADDRQNLWSATWDGLVNFNTKSHTFDSYRHQPGNKNSLLGNTVISLASDGNTLWIGTVNGLDALDLSSKTFTHYTYDSKDSTSIKGATFADEEIAAVYDILVRPHNTIWVCVGGAVNRLDKQTGRFARYLPGGYSVCLAEDSGGTLWLGTAGGLYYYEKELDDFVLYTDPLKVLNRSSRIWHILEDKQKNLWLKTPTGFIKLNVQKHEASRFENNRTSYAYFWNKSYLTKNGEILSSDTSGYFAFYPDSLLNAQPPHIVLSSFTLLDKPVVPGTGSLLSQPIWETADIRLAHNQNQFSFAFTNIDFASSAEDRHLLYKLENYETRWHTADAEGTADYYNIPPGKYIFKVKAVGSNGIWAEKDLSITVALPWWRTWWAYGLYGLLFISVVYVVHRYQKQRLVRAERERTRERELAQAKEIERAYHQLKATQAQLIQSEKMASLGELTAGIAHEIQNPLNFVNNFSEVNTELLEELESEAQKGNLEDVKALAAGIKENEHKINQHGKRADAIVKNMLQHSRASSGEKQPTDINALADEYLRLSYHGLRARDKSFNAAFTTHFDESIGKVFIIPQDIGRVLLNLFNNAFYATHEQMKKLGAGYEPLVSVSTKKVHDKIEIRVQDNGMGISKSVADKIFQPFFTTKPTGQGTGLGLSLSYDIIKAHGGEIKMESNEGEGSTFFIYLLLKPSE